MPRLTLAFFALFVGCGSEPCQQYDFRAGGLCVTTNGYDVDPELVEETVNHVSYAFSRFSFNINIAESLEEIGGVDVEFVNPDNPVLDPGEGAREGTIVRGKAFIDESLIFVSGSNDEDKVNRCWDHYYVLGHEILHIIAEQFMHRSRQENIDHSIEYLFIAWAAQNEKSQEQTVEYVMADEVMYMCYNRFGVK